MLLKWKLTSFCWCCKQTFHLTYSPCWGDATPKSIQGQSAHKLTLAVTWSERSHGSKMNFFVVWNKQLDNYWKKGWVCILIFSTLGVVHRFSFIRTLFVNRRHICYRRRVIWFSVSVSSLPTPEMLSLLDHTGADPPLLKLESWSD